MADENHDKLYTRTEYRRVIAWPERIKREAPFLAKAVKAAPVRKLLDVGCGSGEHTRHFAELGWEAPPVAQETGAGPAGTQSPTDPVLAALEGETLSADELAERLGHDVGQILVALVQHEIAGTVLRVPGGLYQRALHTE